MESHLKIYVHAAFNEIEVKRAEERKTERERRLAEEATRRRKSIIEETQEAGGSSGQVDVEMVEAEADPLGFVLVGESSESLDLNDILHRVQVLQKKRKAREVLMLKWKDEEEVEEETPNFILVGKASSVPYSIKEIVRQIKVKERRREAKIARGEIVDDDSDIEWFGDEEEDEDNNDNDDDKSDKKDDKDNKKDDDDQGASGLLEDDLHHEASTSGKQHADQVFLTNPTVILLHAQHEGELEVSRSRAEMLEELGLNDGKFKFDIEDEIPQSPEKEFEFSYAHEADHYNDVIVEDASDSSDEETDFHYSGIDEIFPSLTEMFKDRNEDEIRRKIVEKVSTKGVPETIPREILAEERKKWFKVMPRERKSLRALQFFTHSKNISWGVILSWGYLEDLQVYAIRQEQGVQYFEFLSDIRTLPWWDVDELVKTKNIKQFYHGLEVK
ncbi:FK506-binding protein 3-like [Helianthus annuus]|uniref:FK506-binding protein 3-like n=1 Tax=Helianthus annuus TaxID=4232 RepID=UPI000B8F6367|nr:FK506-binding protein 3-like [Helianthus annuus]